MGPTTAEQTLRNQLSLIAWAMAFLCGWVMFLAAHAIACGGAKAGTVTYSQAVSTATQK